MENLKPCPNCGSTDLKSGGVYVQCNKCLMTGPQMNRGINDEHADYMDYQNAQKAWNNLPRKR